jgi:hypothetical protein
MAFADRADNGGVWRFSKRSKTRSGKDAVGYWRADSDDDRPRSAPPKRRGGGASGVREPRKPAPSSGGEGKS